MCLASPSALAVSARGFVSIVSDGMAWCCWPSQYICVARMFGFSGYLFITCDRCAGGGIGQPLSLLLKMNKLVTELALYDIAGTAGVAADLSHCNTPVTVSAHTGAEELESCLKGADLVIIPAGIPRKPGMSRDDLFNTNAGENLQFSLAHSTASHLCPGLLQQPIACGISSSVPQQPDVQGLWQA